MISLFFFRPVICNTGNEPSMFDIIKHYYSSHGISAVDAEKYAGQYIEEINKEYF